MTTPIPTFRPALATRRLHHLSPDEILEFSAESEFVGIEWSDFHIPSGPLGRAAELAEATRDRGLFVAGYASAWPASQVAFGQVIGVSLALGAPTIRIGATGIGSAWGNDQGLRDLRRALDMAHTAGISISFAYLPAAYYSTVALIRKTAHPAARLYLRAPRSLDALFLPERHAGLPFYVPDVDVLGSAASRESKGFRLPNCRIRGNSLSSCPTAVFEAAPRGIHIRRPTGPVLVGAG